VYNIFLQARRLSAQQYHQQAEQLAAKLAPVFRSSSVEEDVILFQILLNERFIPVLQRRTQHLIAGGGEG